MDVLRGQSPAVDRRELLVRLLAYNLIRTMMLDAGKQALAHTVSLYLAPSLDVAKTRR